MCTSKIIIFYEMIIAYRKNIAESINLPEPQPHGEPFAFAMKRTIVHKMKAFMVLNFDGG